LKINNAVNREDEFGFFTNPIHSLKKKHQDGPKILVNIWDTSLIKSRF